MSDLQDDPVRRRIKEAMQAKGLEMKPVSEALGKNHAYMHQYLEAGKPKNLPEAVRQELSDMLGIAEVDLIGLGGAPATRPNARIGPRTGLGERGRSIPVYGQAAGGTDGRFIFNGMKIDDVLAPPMLISVPDAYAVFVDGDSMYPRYRSGETVYVHPHLPVRSGDYVIVQVKPRHDGEPPEGYVKEFVGRDARRLRLAQLNPKKKIEFPAQRVISVHKIIMGG